SNATNTATLTLNGTSITPDNYVTLNGRQFITGEKSFYSDVYFAGSEGIVFPDSSKAGIIFSSGEPVSIAGGIDFYNSGWIKFEYTEGGIDVLCDCRGGAYTFWQDSDKKIADAKFSRSALTLGSGEGSGYVLTLNSVDVGAKLTELEARIAALEAKLS
ncbi:MAG: hypothetical protein LUD52_02770, partial [Opitutae bacterium]|nr:hypothetical protein [Opitutae bacterium]